MNILRWIGVGILIGVMLSLIGFAIAYKVYRVKKGLW